MDVLIVAATTFEIEPFLKRNKNADILITGIGIPATIFHLTKKLVEKKYGLVIQAGIGGAFQNSLNPGEVVLVNEDAFADIGMDEKGNFKSLFDTGFLDRNDFPYTGGWLINNLSFFEKNNLPKVRGVTINKITDDPRQVKMIQEKFSPQVESMEGAAFHYVCLQEKINFLQVRAISNQVGERDKTKWQIKKAVENLNNELLKIIEKI